MQVVVGYLRILISLSAEFTWFCSNSVLNKVIRNHAVIEKVIWLGGRFRDRRSRPRPWARSTVVNLAHGRF